jgi:hypothetical protein
MQNPNQGNVDLHRILLELGKEFDEEWLEERIKIPLESGKSCMGRVTID